MEPNVVYVDQTGPNEFQVWYTYDDDPLDDRIPGIDPDRPDLANQTIDDINALLAQDAENALFASPSGETLELRTWILSDSWDGTVGLEVPEAIRIIESVGRPELPPWSLDPSISVPETVVNRTTWMEEIDFSNLRWLTMITLHQSATGERSVMKALKHATEALKLDAKKKEIAATLLRIEAERDKAWVDFYASLANAGTAIVAGTLFKAIGRAVAFSVGQVPQQLIQLGDKQGWSWTGLGYLPGDGAAAFRVDQATLLTQRWALIGEIYDQLIDEFRSQWQDALEYTKKVPQIILETERNEVAIMGRIDTA